MVRNTDLIFGRNWRTADMEVTDITISYNDGKWTISLQQERSDTTFGFNKASMYPDPEPQKETLNEEQVEELQKFLDKVYTAETATLKE